MLTVRENREDIERKEAFAKSIKVPERKPFNDLLEPKDKVIFVVGEDTESQFINSLFSHNDESIIGEKPKVRKYEKVITR